METKLWVKHNVEIAHRLSLLPGKCQNIHGHSLQVTLWLLGPVDDNGIMNGLDFGVVKEAFRAYLNEKYDHHLLMNLNDPLITSWYDDVAVKCYPGLVTFPGDPTIENIARWIGSWAEHTYPSRGVRVNVQETNSNGAEYGF